MDKSTPNSISLPAHVRPDTLAADQAGYRKWWILAAISLSLFLGTVDGSIVNVALPTLMRALQTTFATIQWVVLSYLMGLTILMLSVGRLADIIGKKRIFSLGLGVFVLGSGLCGLSPSVGWLIAFRFVQSIGAAMIVALGVAIVTETWPDTERGKAIGISGGVLSLGLVAGPALGGLILQHLGWRWIFFVNLPVGAVALFLVFRYVPALVPRRQSETFDFLGAGTIGVTLAAFALALTIGQEQGFTAPVPLGLFLVTLTGLFLFLWIESRVSHPMLDLALLRIPTFGLNLFTGLLTFIAIAGVIFLLPFYLELVLGLNQQNTGLLMAVVPTVLGIVAPISGSLSDRLGTRPVTVVGLTLIVIGYLALTTLSPNTTPLGFVLRMLPVGLGMATFQSPNNSAIMGSVPRNRLGVASGTLSTTRTMGQTIGIAVLGAFFTARLHAHAGPDTALQTATPDQIVRAIHDQMFLVATIIALGLVLAVRQWNTERRSRHK